MAKKNYYTVWKGHQTGVFDSWEKCDASVFRISCALYAGFPTYEDALEAYNMGHEEYRKRKQAQNALANQSLF